MNTQQKRLILVAIAATAAIALVGFVIFASTHGVLVVNKSGDGEYKYRKTIDKDFAETSSKSSWVIVPSGDYTVEYKDSNASYVKYAAVPNFLRSVTLTFTAVVQKQVEQMASATLDQLVIRPDSQLVSVNTTQQGEYFLKHPADDPSGYSAEVLKLPFAWYQTGIYQNQLFGLVSKGEAQYDFTPAWYDFTSEPKLANKTYDDEAAALLIRPSSTRGQAFGVYFTNPDSTNALDVFNGTELQYTLGNLKDVADAEEGSKAIAVGNNFAAIGFGANYAGNPVHTHSEDETHQEPSDYVIKIYDLQTGKEVRSVNIGKTEGVASIQVADDGKYVSVVSNTDIRLYDSTNSRLLFTYEVPGATTPQWLDNNRLLFASVENGIFVVNPAEQSAVTLFSSDVLNISAFNVTPDHVAFTAYSKHRGASSGSSPDGYVVRLNQDAKDDNQLIKKLPAHNDQFKLQAIGTTIYAAPLRTNIQTDGPQFQPNTPPESLRRAVTDYLRTNLNNYEQYKLVFGLNL